MPVPANLLEAIQNKARLLTRTLSTAQLSDADLDYYINTFVLYDIPEELRLFELKTTFTFFTEPYKDVYLTDKSVPITDPLYNFKNLYISVHTPLYIAGFQQFYSQSREQFFAIYPFLNNIQSIGTAGDGVTTVYTGVLPNIPVLRNQVLFSSVDAANTGLELHDDGLGNLLGTGNGTIDYVTGAFTLNFTTAPRTGQAIDSQTVPYVPSLPQAMLYYDDKFTLRPVPDQPYRVEFDVFRRPTELLANNPEPDLEQWWQYIAYGTAKKIFEDRMDTESIQQILPEFKNQEAFVRRRTLVQLSNQRVATIYSEQTTMSSGWGGWNGWNGGTF